MICTTPLVQPHPPQLPSPIEPLEGARVAVAMRDRGARERLADDLRGAGSDVRTFDDATDVLLDVEGDLDAVVVIMRP